jgi:hypothetical protein
MMWIDLIQQASVLDVSTWLPLHSAGWESLDLNWFQHLATAGQQFDTDVFRGARTILNRFVQSGQLWAFLIGLFVGYILRTVTTYG